MRWVRAHLYLAFIVRLCRVKSILLDSAIGLDLVGSCVVKPSAKGKLALQSALTFHNLSHRASAFSCAVV